MLYGRQRYSPNSGIDFIDELQYKLDNEFRNGKIASVMGRFYAMDRDSNFTRIQKAYDALVFGKGREFNSAREAVLASYEENIFDEYIIPSVIVENSKPVATIQSNDSIIFYNYRPDRAFQITKTFVMPDDRFDVEGFNRKPNFFPYFAAMSPYRECVEPYIHIAYNRKSVEGTMGEYISIRFEAVRIAETEKFAHVTKFFNGNSEIQFEGEDRVLIPSRRSSVIAKCPR